MARLRLPAGHPDAAYVALCTDTANEWADDYLGRTDDPADPDAAYPPLTAPYPAGVRRDVLAIALREYRRKDAESDVSDSWAEQSYLRVPRDPAAGNLSGLARWRNPREWAPT